MSRNSPPWQRRGGRAIQKISRSIRLSRGRGGFPVNPKGKPPRLRLLRRLRGICLMGAASPPCSRRGLRLSLQLSSMPPRPAKDVGHSKAVVQGGESDYKGNLARNNPFDEDFKVLIDLLKR